MISHTSNIVLCHVNNSLYCQILEGGEGWLGFPNLWSGQELWWNCYLTPVVNFGEIRRAQLAKFTLLTSPGIFFRYFKVCSDAKETVGCVKQRELLHLFIRSKTATLFPEFAVEDLPLGRTAALVSEFAVKVLPLDKTLWWWWSLEDGVHHLHRF